MTDTNIMFNCKALKLAWIPRLIKSVNSNWCTIPNHFFKGVGGLHFLLRCNYDIKHFKDLPVLYKNILDNFNDLKNLYDYDQKQNLILFNNKEILIGGKQFFWRNWFKKGIISIKDLLDETHNLLLELFKHSHLNIHAEPVFYNAIKCSAPFLSTSCP